MTMSYHARVGRGLTLLKEGLAPFVERELKAAYGKDWQYRAADALKNPYFSKEENALILDVQALLHMMWQLWTPIFGKMLGFTERSLVSELKETRNRWAHENGFDYDATYRALDSTRLLLKAISAEQAEEVNDLREEVMRQRYDDQTCKQAKRPSGPLYNGSTGREGRG